MIKKRKHSCQYDVHKAIIYKLSRTQVFWLCVLALLMLGLIGFNAPRALLELI